MWLIVFNIQFTVNIQLGVIFPKTTYSSKVIRDLPLSYLNILASPTKNVHGQISILKYEGMMEKLPMSAAIMSRSVSDESLS